MRFYSLLSVATAALLSTTSWVHAENLPIKKVVLSTSGMAHFEHHGQVSGNEDLSLSVRLSQVNDLLKSLVIYDEKGSIIGVSLSGKQPLSHVFQALPFKQSDLNSPVALLNAYQGANVKIVAGGKTVTGNLMKVTVEHTQTENGGTIAQHRIALMTKSGIKHFIYEKTDSIDFTSEAIKKDIAKALKAVRENSAKDARALDIQLAGAGKRNVGLSYVVAAPLWKASYRMVLPENGEKGFLQGWAVLENMTNNSWDGVDLTLVSGNPVTYQQALYPSYYVSRPSLPVEVFGRVMPRVDTGSMGAESDYDEMYEAEDAPYARAVEAKNARRMEKAKSFGSSALPSPVGAPMAEIAMADSIGGFAGSAQMANMQQAAQSDDATTQVLFKFPQKIKLEAGKSMMVPFISHEIKMEKMFLYQPDTHETHPLAAVRFKNDGKSGLPPGILTLYEESKSFKGNHFVGDAQMPVIAKGEERMITYALDSKTNIDRSHASRNVEGKTTISRGVIKTSITHIDERTYKIKVPEGEDRHIVLEQPKMHNYKITEPKGDMVEATKTHDRIHAKLKAGEKKKITVRQEREGYNTYQIVNLSKYDLTQYAIGKRGKLDTKTRKIFEKLASMRAEVDHLQDQINQLNREKQKIYNDQKRLRDNIRAISGKNSVKTRYINQMDEQEDRLEQIDEQLENAQRQKARAQKSFKDYVFKAT